MSLKIKNIKDDSHHMQNYTTVLAHCFNSCCYRTVWSSSE